LPNKGITEKVGDYFDESHVRIHPHIFDEFKLEKGEILELINPKSKKNIKLRYKKGKIEDDVKIRLHSTPRETLGVALNDLVLIKKTGIIGAYSISFAYFEGQKFIKKSMQLKQMFHNKLITKGSCIIIEKYNQQFQIKVIDFSPDVDEVMVWKDTRFLFNSPNLDNPILSSKLKKARAVSDKLRLDRFKNYLDLDANSFVDKILEWEKIHDFKIEGNYLYFLSDNTSDIIENLELKFDEWQKVEKTPSINKTNRAISPENKKQTILKERKERKDAILEALAELGDSEAKSLTFEPPKLLFRTKKE
jgi:hypothetical protein